jgi:hypothetical protein
LDIRNDDENNDDLVEDGDDFKSEDNESSEGLEKIDLPFKQVRKIKLKLTTPRESDRITAYRTGRLFISYF